MSRRGHVLAYSATFAVALTCLAATAGLLTQYASPPGAVQQAEDLRQRETTLKWQEANAVALHMHSVTVICRRTPDAAAAELRTSLTQIFRRSGAEIGQFEAAAVPGDRRYPHTTPVEFKLHAKVSPDTFLGIIKTLREERPDIIVQTFELVPMDKDVRIMLAGEVVCWDAV